MRKLVTDTCELVQLNGTRFTITETERRRRERYRRDPMNPIIDMTAQAIDRDLAEMRAEYMARKRA